MRLTLVLSILSAIIAFIWGTDCDYLDLDDFFRYFLAFIWFIVIWITYAIARWIIPPIVKWVIMGFGKDNIRKFFATIDMERLKMLVYICIGILSIILSIYFSSSLIKRFITIRKKSTGYVQRTYKPRVYIPRGR